MKPTAEEILEKSELLVKEDCIIFDGVLYEHCKPQRLADGSGWLYGRECYRFFTHFDDYDYVEDQTLISTLDLLFKRY